MKTPREILLERHRGSEPKLNELRKAVLSEELVLNQARTERTARRSYGTAIAEIWREVVWRPRLAWGGMAALWLALWIVNRQVDSASANVVSARSRPAPEAVRAFEEQQRVLVELLQPTAGEVAEPPRPHPQRRSDARTALRSC